MRHVFERIPDPIYFGGDACTIARALLGMYLVRHEHGGERAFMITETEAYDGPQDKASHASHGITPRTEMMFGEPGRFYVYLCYGMHEMLNIVVGPKGYPAAVLIRGIEGANGPGRVTKLLGIGREYNGKTVAPESELWVEMRGAPQSAAHIRAAPRIGVAYAGVWAKKKMRFTLTKIPTL